MDPGHQRSRPAEAGADVDVDAGAALWAHLKGGRLAGFKFQRQHICGPFVLDFFCAETGLAVELDEGRHHCLADVPSHDTWRRRWLARRGVTVLRFSSEDVLGRTEGVLVAIAAALLVDYVVT